MFKVVLKKKSKMTRCNGSNFWVAIVSMALIMINSSNWLKQTCAQGVKGGSFVSNSQQFQQIPQSTGNQLSSSFLQMFSSLTPTEQQQFIKQMSSSNRRFYQQAIQPQTSSFLNEEISSSGGLSPFVSGGTISSSGAQFGTKSGSSFSKQINSQNQIIPSPVQQFFKQQKSSSQSFVQPTIQPTTNSFEFSRQISSAVQPQQIISPQTSNEASFQSTKSIIAQPLPQQQSFFNQVQRVQQVAQPVVLPSSEQSFRRVQSFTSQPLPVQQEAQSGFTSQQFFQQVQPQPVKTSSSSFNRRIQQQAVIPQPIIKNQFSSVSSSSNLAGGVPFDQSAGGFSANLQQEKVDFPITTGNQFEQNQFVQTQNGLVPVTSGVTSINQSSLQESGFDSSDVQQRNLAGNFIGDDSGSVTAASINNKWYIMKPVEDPKALGLEDARAASGSLRRISLGRNQSAKLRTGETETLRSATSSSSDKATPTTSSTSVPKKRSASSIEKAEEKDKPKSESSSLMESDDASEADEAEERRKS